MMAMPVQVYKPQRQVFQFRMYDIGTDEFKQSRRWATREFIEKVGGLMTGRAAKVDEDMVSPEGLTERNFDPEPRVSGFPSQVR
jgi:hypothetical protein